VIQVNWQGQQLDVRRLILRRGYRDSYETALLVLAEGLRLTVADDASDPQPGDFWIGCHPRAGWGGADPGRIGWASIVEVPIAVRLLRVTARDAVRARGRTPAPDRSEPADVPFSVATA
jgi:hypothetical protein